MHGICLAGGTGQSSVGDVIVQEAVEEGTHVSCSKAPAQATSPAATQEVVIAILWTIN